MSQPIFDAHFHIIDPAFPLVVNQSYLPPAFTASDYAAQRPKAVVGGAIVSGSFQAFDQTYLVAALRTLGPAYVGVTQLPASMSDEDILSLDREGVRAVRFNLHRGGSEAVSQLDRVARRIHELAGWHVEFYADAKDLDEMIPQLKALPRFVVDHLGLSEMGLPTLLKLVEAGGFVKATGFGRLKFDIPHALRAIADINPRAILFGTDLPSTRAPRSFHESDIDLLAEALGEDHARLALHDNAWALYRPAVDDPNQSPASI